MAPSSPPPTRSPPAFFSFRCLPTLLPVTSRVSWPLRLSPDRLARLRAVTAPLPAPSQSEVLPLGDNCPASSRGTLLSSSTGVGLTLIPALRCPEGEVGAPGPRAGHQGAGLAPGTTCFCPGRRKPHPKRAQAQLLGSGASSSPLFALLFKKNSNWK